MWGAWRRGDHRIAEGVSVGASAASSTLRCLGALQDELRVEREREDHRDDGHEHEPVARSRCHATRRPGASGLCIERW